MKLLSVNVGLPRTIEWKGTSVTTGIFKKPVSGRVKLRRLNLDGDGQADLSVHGGENKAVYAYPSEHYDFWRGELPSFDLPWGVFGENFTTVGLLESTVSIGDRYRIGKATVMVTQPRMPCYKLGAKFGRDDMVGRFLRSNRSGFYLSVLEEGKVSAGDSIEYEGREGPQLTVADVNRLYIREASDAELLQRAIDCPILPASWRERFQKFLELATAAAQNP
jgi:MOSC domain-containing protein YiiM